MAKKRNKNKEQLSPDSGAKPKPIRKIAKKRTSKVDKPYNHGTMTNAAFFGMLKNMLRQKSRWWLPISECKKAAKKPYKGINKRQKYEYICNGCGLAFPDKEISVDHIIPVGSLKCYDDIAEVTKRLFCEIDGLQVLCCIGENSCHSLKTKEDLKVMRSEQ